MSRRGGTGEVAGGRLSRLFQSSAATAGSEEAPLVAAGAATDDLEAGGPRAEQIEAAPEARWPAPSASSQSPSQTSVAGPAAPPATEAHHAHIPADAIEREGGLASFSRWMEQNVPFLALLAIVFVYEHWGGILTVVWLTTGLNAVNTRMREQVALKDKRNAAQLLMLLVVVLSVVAATLTLFREERLWLQLCLLVPARPGGAQPSFLTLVWKVVVTDLMARFLSIACKIAVALCLCGVPHRRLRQVYRLLEMLVVVYRSVLPGPQWYCWLLAANGSSQLFSSLVTGLYLTFKLAALTDQLRTAAAICRSTLLKHSLYGRYATEAEVAESTEETCAICHDDLSGAVILSCKHIFCEECVCEWLERERTCPLCRAVVCSGPSLQSDGSAPLMCQLF